MIKDFLEDIENAKEKGAYYSALALALTMPDFCGKIQYNVGNDKDKYIRWFNEWIYKYVEIPESKNEDFVEFDKLAQFDGKTCYALRCAYLHCGTVNLKADATMKVSLDRFELCRSPMAEFLLKHRLSTGNYYNQYEVASAATSTEESGNPVHSGTRRILNSLGINCAGKRARQMTKGDYKYYDYLIAMDSNNVRNMMRILGSDEEHKVFRLLDVTYHPRDIADPWYTGNFTDTYNDIMEGLDALIEKLENEN